jgi:hypothetical protein
MNWRLARAWASHKIVGMIGRCSRLFPRTSRRTRIVNALCRPFAGPAMYWAFNKRQDKGNGK